MTDRSGVCERCGKHYKHISKHRSEMRNRAYCGEPDTSQNGECPKCGKFLKRLDLHLKVFPGDTVCRRPARTPTGPTLDEIAETYPSVKWGQDQWYAILRMDNGIFDAILRDMGKQGRNHPLGQKYDGDGWHRPPDPGKGE